MNTVKYINTLNQEINFSIAGIKYKVSAMDSVEIPDKFNYVIDSRKLPLKESIDIVIETKSESIHTQGFVLDEDFKEEKSFLPIDDLVIKSKNKPGPKPKKDK